MADFWFYHLEHRPLDHVLPILLRRALENGWTAVVQATSEERLHALDGLLWTYADDSFMPHGKAGDADPGRQPVYLTLGAETPNKAQVRFCVEGADPMAAVDHHERVAVMIEGRDEAAIASARLHWAALKDTAHGRSYWQAREDGRWEKKA